jgi:hypothetical protein
MTRTIKIPRRIGPVKVSKKIRKEAKKAIRAASSPLMRDVANAAMAAAGRVRRESGRASDEAGAGTEGRREENCFHHDGRVRIDGAKVLDAFRTAAIDGLRRFMEGLDEGLRAAAADQKEEAAPKPAAKPRPKANKAKPKTEAAPKPAAKPKPKAKPRARKPAATGPASPGAARTA